MGKVNSSVKDWLSGNNLRKQIMPMFVSRFWRLNWL